MSTIVSSHGQSRQNWSSERVIKQIQERHRAGLPVNAQSLHIEDSPLLAAGRRYFGSWKAALIAAEVPIPTRRHHRRHPRGHWTRERLIHTIKHHAGSGDPLHAHAMQKLNNRLISAATYHFGSWHEALRQAGLDADAIRARRPWTPDSLLEELRALIDSGADLRDRAARRKYQSLYSAARCHFGSWGKALQQVRETEDEEMEALS
ncbi:MAG: hypothetical protein M0Z36_04140 [Thermaerobacter sp.]|nr:hypothetical protein [Thermaerobacter sp.]